MINSFFRQAGSIGAKSQAKMAGRASVAKSRSVKNQARVYDRSMNKYRSQGMKVGQATQRAVDDSERYAQRVYSQSMTRQQVAAGKRRVAGIGTLGAIGLSGGSNPNQQQTMYRGPMNTGRGVGRYS